MITGLSACTADRLSTCSAQVLLSQACKKWRSGASTQQILQDGLASEVQQVACATQADAELDMV